MALRLKGKAPEHGEVDRRYYMIDVQEGRRRERLSSGTRNRALAEKKEQLVVDALRRDLSIPKSELVALVRGEARAASINAQRASGPTFGQIGKLVCDEVWARRPHTWPKNKTLYDKVLEVVGADTPVEAIDLTRIRKFIDEWRAAKNQAGTINRKLSMVSCVLKRAEEASHIRSVPKIPRQSGERKRGYVLNEEEFDRMMDAVRARDTREMTVRGGHPVLRDAEAYVRFFSALYETGMRPGEALSLPWANIDLAGGVIRVRHAEHLGLRTKTGKSRDIPMTEKCKALFLELWGKDRRGPFKGIRYRRANEHWQGAREALGITDKDCVPYATRHSLATRIIEATGDLNQAKEWLGHSTITLTADTYGHVNSKYLSRGADALNARRASAEEARVTRDNVMADSSESVPATVKKVN